MTNNKKAKERKCLNPFLLHYNQINNSNYKEISTPDEDPEDPLNVDFLCKDLSTEKIIAIDILGFHHSENLARGDNFVRRNMHVIEKELKGKVRGNYFASILYNVLNCARKEWTKRKRKIVEAIINEAKSMKLGEKRFIKAYQINLSKISDDGDMVGLGNLFFSGAGPGAGLSELINNIIEKNLKQFKSAKECGCGTFLLIDDKRELLRADHPLVLRDLRDSIASIPSQELRYIDHIFLRSRKTNFSKLSN